MSEIESRIARLEAIEEIKQLKARYLASCDQKKVAEVRDCFVEGDVLIDYGAVGVFTDREQLIEVFTELACHDHMVEMHHAQNPQITINSHDSANATWGLFYHLINNKEKTFTQLGGYYQDEYQLTKQGWKIRKTVFRPSSSMVGTLDSPTIHFAGNPAGDSL